MAYKIVWTKKALASFENILDYLQKEYDANTASEFAQKVYHTLDLLAEFPQMGSVEVKSKNIRGFLITKQNSSILSLESQSRKYHPTQFF